MEAQASRAFVLRRTVERPTFSSSSVDGRQTDEVKIVVYDMNTPPPTPPPARLSALLNASNPTTNPKHGNHFELHGIHDSKYDEWILTWCLILTVEIPTLAYSLLLDGRRWRWAFLAAYRTLPISLVLLGPPWQFTRLYSFY